MTRPEVGLEGYVGVDIALELDPPPKGMNDGIFSVTHLFFAIWKQLVSVHRR